MIFYTMFAWCAGLVYIAFVIIVLVGLKKLPRTVIVEDDSLLPTATLVVAARDEETRIGRLLDSLEAQDYPREKFDVIIVDDRSSDNTGELVRQRKANGVRFKVLRIRDDESPSVRSPKKYALSRGIDFATGEIIVTTDADCWMGKRWLRTLLSPFVSPEVHGATGVSRFVRDVNAPQPWWSDYEGLEHLFYSVMAAGSIGAGHVCNAHGSNLAARKAVYDRIGGYASNERVASGDDVFLLQDVAKHGGKVVFIERIEGYVYSQPVDTAREWVNQRARWSSKGFYYPPYLMSLLVGTFAFFAAIAASFPLVFTKKLHVRWAVLMLMTKVVLESILMKTGARTFGEKVRLDKFLITELLHGPAILFAGIRGQFFSFTWKGQKYSGLDGLRNTQPSKHRASA